MKKRMKAFAKKMVMLSMVFALLIGFLPMDVQAALSAKDTGLKLQIKAEGEYKNWDGISNVAQFADEKGNYCFAYDAGKYVYVVKTKNGKVDKKQIKLKKKYSLFGGIACDSNGYYYLVTGGNSNHPDPGVNKIFISKYNKNGKLLKTAGDNGSCNLPWYYGSEYWTKRPFWAGSCDVAVNGKYVTVHYSRELYSEHQSSSVFMVNTKNMKGVFLEIGYQGHSFAQRVIPYKKGFLYAGEGDCYDRAFTITITDPSKKTSIDKNIFHFWVKQGTLDAYDMYTLNNNFAHMGGLAQVDSTRVAFVGTSVKALSSKALNQNEQLFIQIFNPSKDLSKKSAYITKGTRSGYSGPNGMDKVKNYGVKWLTNFDKSTTISHPQVVSNGKGTIIILFEKYVNGVYKGVYYMKLNKNGAIKKKITCLSSTAYLNPCRMPVYSKGKVYWTANMYNDSGQKVYIFSLKI